MCEQCISKSDVIDSRYVEETRVGICKTIRRRRECKVCGDRFSTYEIDADLLVDIMNGEIDE